jgi:hypothetical protein
MFCERTYRGIMWAFRPIKYRQLHLYGASKNLLSPWLIFQNEENILNSALSLQAPLMWYKHWLQPSSEWLLVENCWTALLSVVVISRCCEGFPHCYSHYSEPVIWKKCSVSNLSHHEHHDNTTWRKLQRSVTKYLDCCDLAKCGAAYPVRWLPTFRRDITRVRASTLKMGTESLDRNTGKYPPGTRCHVTVNHILN